MPGDDYFEGRRANGPLYVEQLGFDISHSLERGSNKAPYAFVISAEQRDVDAAHDLVETLGNHVCFGDGLPINTEDLYHVREISRNLEVIFPWQAADILVIDNTLAMHGRKPFSGDRRVVVAMA